MSNEIKVGDKVRVREDAPRILRKVIPSKVFEEESKVVAIDGEMAVVWTEPIHKNLIPTKYLVKVDAEKKEAKYKAGDKVKALFTDPIAGSVYCVGTIIGHDASDGTYLVQGIGGLMSWFGTDGLTPYTEPTTPKYKKGDRVKFKNIYELQKVKDKSFRWMLVMFASKEATITAVEDNGFYRVDIAPSIGGINDDMIECKVEPTEQTEAEKPNVGSIKIPVEVDLTESYWDSYTADLAKEVALKVANKFNAPHEAAEYAVSVAQAVVEGLKSK